MYDFDEIIDRSNTDAVKVELCKELFGSTDIMPMWVADMDFLTPSPILKIISERIANGILGYTLRTKAFAQSIVAWQAKRHNWTINEEWIEYSPGVVPALTFSILALTQPGDGVIIQPPIYPPFFDIVKANNRQLVLNPLTQNSDGTFQMNLDEFERLASQAENKIFILCHPHNPVGRDWSKEELTAIGDICIKHGITVLSDEIHADIMLNRHKHIPFAAINEEFAQNSLTFMAASKTFNIAGLNTSYVISANAKLLRAYRKTITSLHLQYNNIFGPLATQAAYTHCESWLNDMLYYISDNVDFACKYITQHIPEIKISKPEATYLLWLDFSELGISRSELQELIYRKAKVGLNDGLEFGNEFGLCMRMNLASPIIVVEEALNRIDKAVATIRK